MDPFLGEIRNFGFNFAPTGWAQCAGQLLPISQNAALFSLLGTAFGGDGVQTFALPDLRSRVAVNQGQGNGLSPYEMGQVGGEENHTLISTEMPRHNHSVSANQSANATSPAGAVPSNDARNPSNIYASASDGTQMNANMLGSAGSGGPHNNLQPYLATNFCIALQGVYPSRS